MSEKTLVYRITYLKKDNGARAGYDVFIDGSLQHFFIPPQNSIDPNMDPDLAQKFREHLKKKLPEMIKESTESAEWWVKRFKEEREENAQHSDNVYLPDSPSDPKYKDAHETLWALRKDVLSKRDLENATIEYFGEGEPWVPNHKYKEWRDGIRSGRIIP